jgi:hypothetical protein
VLRAGAEKNPVDRHGTGKLLGSGRLTLAALQRFPITHVALRVGPLAFAFRSTCLPVPERQSETITLLPYSHTRAGGNAI